MDSFYANFINTTFIKIPIPHLTPTIKQKFLTTADFFDVYFVICVLHFWLETFWVVFHLVLFEARRVPWFAGGYHGMFWLFGLKPSGLFPVWYCLRPGASHGLRAATMERSGLEIW